MVLYLPENCVLILRYRRLPLAVFVLCVFALSVASAQECPSIPGGDEWLCQACYANGTFSGGAACQGTCQSNSSLIPCDLGSYDYWSCCNTAVDGANCITGVPSCVINPRPSPSPSPSVSPEASSPDESWFWFFGMGSIVSVLVGCGFCCGFATSTGIHSLKERQKQNYHQIS